jgi:uncharacterized phage protein (TIGR02220 family)
LKYIRVKNWKKHQHYKGRTPPWIKLHAALLDDYDYECLTDLNKIQLIAIWLLASRSREYHPDGDPLLPHDETYLLKKSGLKGKIDLKSLITSGFIICYHSASAVLATDKQLVPTDLDSEAYKEEAYKAEAESGKPDDVPPYLEIVSFLNERSGKNFSAASDTTRTHIHARWKDGFRVEQFKAVIERKCSEWKGDPKMDKFLRPQTLFIPSNFEAYLNEREVKGNGQGTKGKHGQHPADVGPKAEPGKYDHLGTVIDIDGRGTGTETTKQGN